MYKHQGHLSTFDQALPFSLCSMSLLAGLSEQLFQSIWDTHGPSILAVLDSPPAEACRQLQRCRKIGPKSAERFKSRWDASFGVDSSGAGSGAGRHLGLRVEDLMASPPALDFAWGPETRCYSPALHQVWGTERCGLACRFRFRQVKYALTWKSLQ